MAGVGNVPGWSGEALAVGTPTTVVKLPDGSMQRTRPLDPKQTPALTFDALPPAGPRDLDLTVAAHFHSGQAQIMMVLDHAEVARLAKLLPDLGADIAAGRSWPGKDVTVRWGGGKYVTKLVHHINNGNVKFTVRKRDAKRLWDHLEELLQGTNPTRDFSARYSLGIPPGLDEFFVDFRMAPVAP